VLKHLANCVHGPRFTQVILCQYPKFPSHEIFLSACQYFSVNLQRLDFTDCTIINDDCILAITYYAGVGLKSLKLKGCFRIKDIACTHIADNAINLTELDLSFCRKLTDKGIIAISSKLSSLTWLDLSHNSEITTKSIIEVAMKLRNLKYLNLHTCIKIQDESMKYIARNLQELEYLEIEGCSRLTDQSIYQIAKYCHKLKLLNISKCITIGDSIISLTEANPNLTALKLQFLPRVTDATLLAITENLPHIQTVMLEGCNNISNHSVSRLRVKKMVTTPFLITHPVTIRDIRNLKTFSEGEILNSKANLKTNECSKVLIPDTPEKISPQVPLKRRAYEDPKNVKYPYAILSQSPKPSKCDPKKLELYLNSSDFETVFKMSSQTFESLPSWKQEFLKQQVNLY